MKDETKKSIKLQLFVYFILISTLIIVGLLSLVYLPFIQNNLAHLNAINVSLITMLVLINGAYGYFTWQIVDETRNDRKVAFIERRLEKLYLPLKDVLENPVIYSEKGQAVFDNIIPFQYLADKELKNPLDSFIKKVNNSKLEHGLPFDHLKDDKLNEIVEKDIEEFNKELGELIE